MDQFTQRMLERARARQEKINQKLASTGQTVPKRKPLTENVSAMKSATSPVKSPIKTSKESILSPKKSIKDSALPVKSPARRSIQRMEPSKAVSSPAKPKSDVVVTRKEFKGNSIKNSMNRRDSDVSVEINIMHRDDITIEVQVEERDAPINVVYGINDNRSGVVIDEIEDNTSKKALDKQLADMAEHKNERAGLRNKSRLDRLGNLYSDTPNLSSPIHRTEQDFSSATPPLIVDETPKPKPTGNKDGKKKFGRLAALADQINNWEDDLTHHSYHPSEPTKKPTKKQAPKVDKHDASTLDVSIHSINDINKVLSTTKSSQNTKSVSSRTFTKPGVQLDKNIVAQLEPKQRSTPSATSAPKMATMVASTPPNPTVTKKPSIKKYKAPLPPQQSDTDTENSESDKDKENNVVEREENDNEEFQCKQTKTNDKPVSEKNSPVVKRLAPKVNNERSSVLSKAAMFETGSPKAKDPAEMSLRERKALFEKNKGAAIIPKAPFGLAPSAKTLHGDNKADNKPVRPVVQPVKTTPTKSNNSSRTNSKENLPDDNISQSSLGGGIKGKLAALFNKEQTISESTITNKFKLEREKEMEMLQNRFNVKPSPQRQHNHDSDDDDVESSENAPLMGSTISLPQTHKKPEIIANIPKVTFDDKTKSETALHDREGKEDVDRVVGMQPVKRRSSQDSPVVLSVLEDVKRIKVNDRKAPETNGVVTQQPKSLYPHLSDIETDTSHRDDDSCCGSSEKINERLNKSDNWAETSFGREVMNVVKKNNTSYQKAVRESDSDSSREANDSELDDLLDEALEDSEGPTPPKVNKQGGSLSSKSFVYQEQPTPFKSPLKAPPVSTSRVDKGSELVHSVSFYRRMQNASSTPSTPMRIIRHQSPDREPPPTPNVPATNVTTVRQRIKELQAEIAKQQTVISQASQALNLCASTIEFSGSTEQAEGERLLLLATHRRQACLHEVQRLQVEGAGVAASQGMASLTINGLVVPLKRDYIRQLNADGAVGHHAVCLLKCRDRVIASSMQQTQPTSNTLHYPDEIRMDGLASDFKVTVEVYLLQASKEVLPHDVKYHISNKKANSKLLTPKSKVSELKTPKVQSPGGPLSVRSPQFQLHGYCIFALQQATRKSFTLNKVPCGSPLEGSITMEISARLRVPAPEPHAAFLTAFDDVSGLGAWHRRWFRLQSPRLAYWKYPDDVQKKMPIGDIDLSTVISEKVIRAPRDLCARPNTLLLETSVPPGMIVPDSGSLVYVKRSDGTVIRRHLLAADTTKDRDEWLECLNKALEYVRCCGTEED